MTMQSEQRTPRQQRAPRDMEQPAVLTRYVDLAADGLLVGLTRKQVVAALAEQIERDVHYLAYHKACRRRTRYDEQVTSDLRALALAICWLAEPDGRAAAGRAPVDPMLLPVRQLAGRTGS